MDMCISKCAYGPSLKIMSPYQLYIGLGGQMLLLAIAVSCAST